MKSIQVIATGVAIALVGTALFLPGRQTVSGIKAGGTATSGVFKAAEGL